MQRSRTSVEFSGLSILYQVCRHGRYCYICLEETERKPKEWDSFVSSITLSGVPLATKRNSLILVSPLPNALNWPGDKSTQSAIFSTYQTSTPEACTSRFSAGITIFLASAAALARKFAQSLQANLPVLSLILPSAIGP